MRSALAAQTPPKAQCVNSEKEFAYSPLAVVLVASLAKSSIETVPTRLLTEPFDETSSEESSKLHPDKRLQIKQAGTKRPSKGKPQYNQQCEGNKISVVDSKRNVQRNRQYPGKIISGRIRGYTKG